MRKKIEMKKRIVSIMLCILMVVGLVPMMPEVMKAETAVDLVDSTTSVTLRDTDGDGYYEIGNKNDLIAFSNLVNAGNTQINGELTANIDFNPGFTFTNDGTYTGAGTPEQWIPIGNTSENPYRGSFNGNNHTILGLYVNDSDKTMVGLFGVVLDGAIIEKLGVTNTYFCAKGFAGGIVGLHKSGSITISNCYSNAIISATSNYVGGIAGLANVNANIENCCFYGFVQSNSSSCIGEIAGEAFNNGKIKNCYYEKNNNNIYGVNGWDESGVAEGKTQEQFMSGEVTYLLNNKKCCTNGVPEVTWYQELGYYPKLSSGKVVHYYDGTYKNHDCDVHYTSSGDTITGKCDNHCSIDFGSVTVKAPTSLIYDGAQKEAIVEGTLLSEDKSQISVLLQYDGIGASAPTGAGTHVAEISISASDGDVKARVEYTIQPMQVTSYAAPTPNTLTYNGEAQNLISAGTVEDSGFHMEYSLDGTNYSTTIPTATDAGTYIVYSKAVGADNTNYKTLEFDPIIVEIKKAPISIEEVTVGTTQKIYDGKNAVEITEAVISGAIDSESVSIDLSKLTGKLSSANAGIYNTVIIGGLDAEGLLTGADAENYQIKVPSGEVNLSSPVTIERAPIEVNSHTIVKRYVYTVDTTENIDVTEFLPEDCGEIAVSQLDISGDFTLTEDGVVFENDTLTYTICKGEIGKTGTINFTLLSENYGTVYVTLDIVLVDKFEVIAADNVTLKNSTLYVGEALSKLEFNSVKFMANGQEIEGTLAWKDASMVPAIGTTMAEWVFTPKDTDRYATLKGTIAIAVYEAPHIQGEDGKQGWDVVRDTVADAKEGDTVTVDMNGTLVVAGDVIEDIKGKDITIVFDMGDGIHWTVNGKDVTAENIADINMGVFISTPEFPFNAIPVTVLNAVTGENSHVEINLAHNGEFGFTAVLSINLEAKNAGLFAKLYYFNPTKQTLEFICADEIAADGTTDLTFTHASDYAIVIDEVVADAEEQEGSANQGGAVTPGGVQAPQTGDVSNVTLWILFLMAGLGMLVFVQKKYVR